MVPMEIRTAVRKEGIPRGTLGKIVGFAENQREAFIDFGDEKPVVYAENEVEILSVAEALGVQASHGQVERTRIAQGIQYARTGLPEEMLEVSSHLRDLAEFGYSPMYMQNHLISMGYNSNIIRNAFKKVFGMEFEDAVNIQYLDSPGNIPQLNLGWGAAKDGKGTIFIMPMTTWYADFQQINDQDRVELHRHKTLVEALECVEKRVKKLMRWDPPLKKTKNPLFDVTQFYRQPQLFVQAMEQYPVAFELGRKLLQTEAAVLRKEMVDDAYLSGSINKPMHFQFLKVFCDLKEEAEHEVREEAVEKALKNPDVQEMGDQPEGFGQIPVDVASAIRDYLQTKNSNLRDFEIRVRGYTYHQLGPVPKDLPDEESVTAATAIVKVAIDVVDRATEVTKHALLAFSVIGETIKDSKDSLKDIETSKIYALTDEGLADYFRGERGETSEIPGR